MIGLYVHVPFCAGKCFYCNFMTTAFRSPERQAQYLEALSRECAFYRERLKSKRFDTLYVGGGTPSCLGPESTERLFAIVRKHFRFGRNAEVTFEVNPEDVDGTAALAWKRLGISRISLGAQCFDDGILRRLGRSHGAVKIAEAFGSLRAAGFGNINLDLMLALPGQSVRSFERSLAEAAALDPEHVSLYELVVEPKTALGRLREHSRLRLPAEGAQVRMLVGARNYLQKKGYRHYELLNYAKAGFESRHNNIYWVNGQYLGLGPSAYSYIEGRRYRLAKDFEQYLEKAALGCLKPCEEETLGESERLQESFLLALRLVEGAKIKRFIDFLQQRKQTLERLEKNGLIRVQGGFVRLTAKGQLFAESVFVEFVGDGR